MLALLDRGLISGSHPHICIPFSCCFFSLSERLRWLCFFFRLSIEPKILELDLFLEQRDFSDVFTYNNAQIPFSTCTSFEVRALGYKK